MKRFLSAIDSISEWSGKIFAFVVVAATLVVVYAVVMRYVFNAPRIWGLELTIYLCAATYMIGGAYALLYGAHVKVDIFYRRWTPRVRAIVDMITALFFFAGVGLMLWVGAEWTAKAIIKGATSGSIWDPIIWPMRLLIPLGSFLLLLQGVAKFIRDFNVARTGEHHEH